MYFTNNQNFIPKKSEDEFDFQDFLAKLEHYKLSIAIITLMALFLAVIYAYVSVNVYQANSTIQIQPAPENGPAGDMLSDALSGTKVSIENEIVLLKSNSVVEKALEKVPMSVRYYKKNGFQSVEVYKNAPFTIECESYTQSLLNYKFQLHPINETQFRLTIKPSLMMKLIGKLSGEKMIYLSKEYTYGVPIQNSLFSMTVRRNNLIREDYDFTISTTDSLIKLIISSLNVTAASDKGSVIVLSYQDNVPQRAEDMLNALAYAYQVQNIEKKSASAKKTLNFIDKELQTINQSLQNSATNLKDYKSSHTVTVDLKDKAVLASQNLSELEKQKDELDIQEGVFKDLLLYIQNNNSVMGIDTGSIGLAGSSLLPLIEKLQEATTLRATLAVDYTEKHPSVIKVNQQINSLRASLKGSIESNIRGIQQRKMILEKIIQKNNSLLAEIPEEEKQLSKLMNGLTVNQQVYEYLLQKRAETAILASSTVSGDIVIDHSYVDNKPVKPVRELLVFLGMILGLFIGIGQALIRNSLAATIQSIADVEKHTSLPILSVLPYFQNKKSLYKDALRVLLTKLEYSFTEEKPKILTLTSSVLGEGRTTTGFEFAQVAALSGKKVILMDMDMRNPSIHQKFQFKNEIGISTYLRGQCEFNEILHHIDDINLDVVCGGSSASNSYDLIMSERFKVLLERLKEEYHYIILIAPPVGLVADALVLMRLSDLNLVVFKALYSKKDFVNTIDRFVKEHQFKNVGIILNSLELKKIRRWNIK